MGAHPQTAVYDNLACDTASPSDSFRNIQPRLHNVPSAATALYFFDQFAISFQFGSESLKRQILPAFRHLECPDTAYSLKAPFTIYLHDLDSASYATDFCKALHPQKTGNDIWLFESSDLTFIVQQRGPTFSAVDWNLNAAYWLVPNAATIPYLERAAPLRLLLSHWLAKQKRHFVHAAAIGKGDSGVLIIGRGGSGKSTTALACVADGLEYASDDHCLVSTGPDCSVHSLYGTAKLATSDLDRFPSLAPAVATEGRPENGKSVFFLDRLPSLRLSRGFRLRAILLANIIHHSARTNLRRLTESQGFRALTPSCALHFPTERLRALQCFNSLVRHLPTYRLNLGYDPHCISNTIEELLSSFHK